MPILNISFTAGPLQIQCSRGLFSLESIGALFQSTSSGGGGNLTVQTLSLANAVVGSPYSMTLSASGGTPPYLWSIVSATPDTGLWLQCGGGALFGTPQMAEVESVVLQVSDSAGNTAQMTFTLTVTT